MPWPSGTRPVEDVVRAKWPGIAVVDIGSSLGNYREKEEENQESEWALDGVECSR